MKDIQRNSEVGPGSIDVDVTIAGGGVAGQCLARQLRLYQPDVSVAVIDALARPLPEAAFKVGESTIIIGAAYYQNVLQLADYLFTRQIRKLGLRYFYGDGKKPLSERPEMGKSTFHHLLNEWQLDRGSFENDLRAFNEQAGVRLIEGANIVEVQLGAGDEPHTVSFVRDGKADSIRSRWLIDASGRRCLLAQKLGLGPARAYEARSSAWWRVKGRVDVANLVPRELEHWHDRVPGDNRYNSTTHLMGPGYWVWLIPLFGGVTSVGIVTLESMLPCRDFNSFEKAMKWLDAHEPYLADHLRKSFAGAPLDFKVLKDYSYRNTQAVSYDRWACVGEASGFADPFYSPGSDAIGFMNGVVSDLIRADRAGTLTEAICARWNQLYLEWLDKQTTDIESSYPYHHNALVMPAKTFWDWCYAAATNLPLYHGALFKKGFVDDARTESAVWSAARERLIALGKRMRPVLTQWSELSTGSRAFKGYLNYTQNQSLIDLIMGTLTSKDPMAEWPSNLLKLEKVAQAIFRLAVEDTMPQRLASIPHWVNVWAAGLEPAKWEEDGLFRPTTEPCDYTEYYDNIRSLLTANPRPNCMLQPFEHASAT